MEPGNKRPEGFNKMLGELMHAFRERAAVMRRPLWNISRVSSINSTTPTSTMRLMRWSVRVSVRTGR